MWNRSSPRFAAAESGSAAGWWNFWHHLGGKTEMTVQTKAPDSQFAYVVLAARRARQIMAGGAAPRAEPPHPTPPTPPVGARESKPDATERLRRQHQRDREGRV